MNHVATPWVDGLTIAQALSATVARCGERDALVFPQRRQRLTYAEFATAVRRTARALVALDVQCGEHVAIWATNAPEWVILQFAAACAGVVLVNINPAYRAHELRYVLEQADVTTLFLTDSFKASDYFAMLAEILPQLRAAASPRLRHVVSIKSVSRPGIASWDEFLDRSAEISDSTLEARQAGIRPDDVVNIQYTSGTTGFPKGALLTHRNLLMNAFYTGHHQRFTPQDRLAVCVPLYHCFGSVMGSLACTVHGAAMVFPSESFDALAALEAVHAERCTAIYGVPTMFIAELNHPRFAEFDLSSLRTGVMAGSPCPIEVMRSVVERMGTRELTICYGLTEASPVITQTLPDDDLEHRVATVGQAIPGVAVRIVRPSTLDDVPDGEPGELLARGHGIMKGYYSKPAETAAAITPDGWLHTGDLAMRMPDGYYRITGRIKDMIIRGGENIYPREIEEFLYTHPAIADAQVVGLPDERFGEEIAAWLRLKPGAIASAEDVRAYCRERIAHYKVPRYVVFVDEYPTTVTGKVQKYRLRELGIDRFGLQRAAGIETA
jgi:fatty-acyl-CoA synthase